MEKEQMLSWQKARPGDRILEVDVPLSYGAYDITQPTTALNLIHFNWDPTKPVGIYVKVCNYFQYIILLLTFTLYEVGLIRCPDKIFS